MTTAPAAQQQLFGNDTLCRSLLITTSSVNSTTDVQCNTCLTYGCTWCKRAKFPFCWSGSSNDLGKSNSPVFNSCPANSAVYSTNRDQAGIVALCRTEQQISAGAVAALIIWALILICCIGACCCTIVYFAYNRGKRHMGIVHADDFSQRGGHYVAQASGEPWQYDHEGPVQVGILTPTVHYGNGLQLSELGAQAESNHGEAFDHNSQGVPVAIAHPIL